ncbi:MAG: NADH dehydrogenase [Deltaproteobacteria bacterium RIFOXYA12_FULL_58_15]|nr:MAG: NADH dehydrogenase [Deltaproteobacteria bacterium RIFOXYA12_FULL_58_15]
MDAVVIHENLKARFGDRIGSLTVDNPDPFIVVDRSALKEIGTFLKDEPGYEFDFLENLTGLDLGDKFVSVYHLLSYKHRHSLVLRVELSKDQPTAPSVSEVWPAANWHEREQYDLLGITYTGHPDLRRIMLPEDWVGHPLRKDYEQPKGYHGISHERANVLDGFKALDDRDHPLPVVAPSKPEADGEQ